MDIIRRTTYILALAIALASCRKEQEIIPAQSQAVNDANPASCSFYLLNEGNMGSNKCSLDWYDNSKDCYWKNIFGSRNPSVTLGLGDVGNDIAIYDGKLYVVVNCSNLVEVMDAKTAKHISSISIPNCRYICFDGNYAYVSSYAGETHDSPADRTGFVARIDTKTLTVVSRCNVGYQPEELAVSDGKLFVANSGGYNAPDYDNRVSVIDLATFTLSKSIEVAINLHHIVKATDGTLWVSSRGDYGSTPSAIHVLDPKTDSIVESLDIECSGLACCGSNMYVYSSNWTSGKAEYKVIDVESRKVVNDSFIKDSDRYPRTAYGIAVDPVSEDVYLMDATDYVTPGYLSCFSNNGDFRWKVTTGDIPSRIAFIIP